MLIAHLSDPHVSTRPDGGDAVTRFFEAVSRLEALRPLPDAVVVTGDLTDNGAPDEYVIVRGLLERLAMPVHVVPGNHDAAPELLSSLGGSGFASAALPEPDRCYYRVDHPEVSLICCDSSVPGEPYGMLGAAQLEWLDAELGGLDGRQVLVAMHHPPVRTGIGVMDEIMLRDADALASVLERHRPVQRILAGHVHRSITAGYAGAVVSIAPSTYRQVHLNLDPHADTGAFVAEPPGFLLHQVSGASAVTHLVPVRHTSQPAGQI
ncbi:phosphodiesterase [Solicola gregarius]|uniref:Phosphodiesterase n=1 Tax=Solicola gregarius TaxID=2908642 RepID=A0AA46TLW5_9ACTN|nr:phosphodiesterase [Solicola gregarius]UYM07533.1 phosphodiesterase [Solicola gregarius]